MKKIIVLLLGVMIVVGCSKKPITEDEAIQIAKDDLKVSEDEYSVIFGNNSYDEEKQEYRFYLVESEEKSYEYIIDAMSGEIKEKI